MLRRVIEGCGLALVIVMLGHRLGAGALFPVLMIVGLVAFTGWRVRRVWKRYQQRIVIQSYRPKPDSAIANEIKIVPSAWGSVVSIANSNAFKSVRASPLET